MPGMEQKSNSSPEPEPKPDFSSMSEIQVIQFKMRNGVDLTPEEYKLWAEKLEEERIDDQPERRGRY